MRRTARPNALPRRGFLITAECPHCQRAYFVEGSAPIDEGHQPHYFSCECGRKVMGAVPVGAEVSNVHLVRSAAPGKKIV